MKFYFLLVLILTNIQLAFSQDKIEKLNINIIKKNISKSILDKTGNLENLINENISKYFNINEKSGSFLEIDLDKVENNISLKLKYSNKKDIEVEKNESFETDLNLKIDRYFGLFYLAILNPNITEYKIISTSKGVGNKVILTLDKKFKAEDIKLYITKSPGKDFISKDFIIKNNKIEVNKLEPGIEYLFKIVSKYSGIESEVESNLLAGFSKPTYPITKNLNKLIKERSKNIKNILEKNDKKNLEFLKKYYMHPVKLNLVMNISKDYLKNKQLVVFADISNFTLNQKLKTIDLYDDKKTYFITFNSNKFFRMYNKFDNKDLFQRLIENGIIYAKPEGYKKIPQEDGTIKYVPYYHAFGLSTGYYKFNSKWKKNTIMFGTSDKALKKKMEKAHKKAMRDRARKRKKR